MFAHKFYRCMGSTLTTLYQTLCMVLFGCLLALWGSTMHPARLCGGFQTIFFCLVCRLPWKKKEGNTLLWHYCTSQKFTVILHHDIVIITLVYRGSILQTRFSHDWSSIAYMVSNKVQLSSNIIPASMIVNSVEHGVTDSREERATIAVHWTWSKYHMPAETQRGWRVRWSILCELGWGWKSNNGLVATLINAIVIKFYTPIICIVWFNSEWNIWHDPQ